MGFLAAEGVRVGVRGWTCWDGVRLGWLGFGGRAEAEARVRGRGGASLVVGVEHERT